jgi:hypothetical protein
MRLGRIWPFLDKGLQAGRATWPLRSLCAASPCLLRPLLKVRVLMTAYTLRLARFQGNFG